MREAARDEYSMRSDISPSGDPFLSDSRNVKAVQEDVRKAHSADAKFARLETKEDILFLFKNL